MYLHLFPGTLPEQLVKQDDDYIRNYGLQFINLTVMLMQLKDTAAEGDGDRAAVNEKLLLTFFKANNSYSKYALEMLISICQKGALLSERMAQKVCTKHVTLLPSKVCFRTTCSGIVIFPVKLCST